jgi:hypothetical protein
MAVFLEVAFIADSPHNALPKDYGSDAGER